MSKPELDIVRINLLLEPTTYLIDNEMTFQNRDKYYDTYGKVISELKETSFKTNELQHTFTKELEFAMQAGTEEEFLEPYIQAYLPVIKREMRDVQRFVAEQEKLLQPS